MGEMTIDEAILIVEGFQDALQEIIKSVDNQGFKSDVYMFSVHHLKKIIEKYKKSHGSKIVDFNNTHLMNVKV